MCCHKNIHTKNSNRESYVSQQERLDENNGILKHRRMILIANEINFYRRVTVMINLGDGARICLALESNRRDYFYNYAK